MGVGMDNDGLTIVRGKWECLPSAGSWLSGSSPTSEEYLQPFHLMGYCWQRSRPRKTPLKWLPSVFSGSSIPSNLEARLRDTLISYVFDRKFHEMSRMLAS